MHYHWQNLNEKKRLFGIPYHGRAWCHFKNWELNWEWNLWSTFCHAYWECHDGWRFGLAFPPVGLWLTISGRWLNKLSPKRESTLTPGLMLCDDREVRFAIHNWTLWIHPWSKVMETSSSDPWWVKGLAIHLNYPWELRHDLTEILDGRSGTRDDYPAVWSDKGKEFMKSYEERQKAAELVSLERDYSYTTKSGEIQRRIAIVHVTRMTWRRRWLPFMKKVRTSIDVKFNEEIGEKVGTWKGGCVGCGYDMLPGETMLRCLWRMEHERKFT